jgi:hypothetical protein
MGKIRIRDPASGINIPDPQHWLVLLSVNGGLTLVRNKINICCNKYFSFISRFFVNFVNTRKLNQQCVNHNSFWTMVINRYMSHDGIIMTAVAVAGRTSVRWSCPRWCCWTPWWRTTAQAWTPSCWPPCSLSYRPLSPSQERLTRHGLKNYRKCSKNYSVKFCLISSSIRELIADQHWSGYREPKQRWSVRSESRSWSKFVVPDPQYVKLWSGSIGAVSYWTSHIRILYFILVRIRLWSRILPSTIK